jgi:hypothetical protein
MAVNTAKRRAKNQAILASQKKFEPTIDQLDFTTSLSRALGYYSIHTGVKEQKLFAIEFFSKKEPKIAKQLKKLPDYRFSTFGSLCRLMTNEQTDLKQLSDYSPFFTNTLKSMLEDAQKITEKIEVAKEQKMFAIDFFLKKEPKIAKQLKKLPDYKFTTFGSLCRLMSNEQTDLKQLSTVSPFYTNTVKVL